jgi:hypothetical protein
MRKLNAKARARVSDLAGGGEDTRQRRLVLIGIYPEAAMSDAAEALYGGGFHDHETGARQGEAHQVLKVPIRGASVLRRILAHRCDDDAIGKLDGTHGERIKEVRHGEFLAGREMKTK